jgi:hypothetical protein
VDCRDLPVFDEHGITFGTYVMEGAGNLALAMIDPVLRNSGTPCDWKGGGEGG